jgi:hypothetical protein
MTKPSWQAVSGMVKVESKPPGFWTTAIPFVSGPRLLRLTVQPTDDKGSNVPVIWRSAAGECGADGLKGAANTGMLLTNTSAGALIGKIGGSTADLPDAQGQAGASTAYSGRKVFPVGSYAVIALADTDSGPLFLTMNDAPDGFATHSGALWVLIEEAAF